jgi:hypothetical protein
MHSKGYFMSHDLETILVVLPIVAALLSLLLFVGTWIDERRRRAGTANVVQSSFVAPTSASPGQAEPAKISFLAERSSAISALFQAVVLRKPELLSQHNVNRAVKHLGSGQIDSVLRLIEQALKTNGPQWTALRRVLAGRRLEPDKELKLRIQEAVSGRMKNGQLELTDISEALLYCAWYLSFVNLETLDAAKASYFLGQYYLRLDNVAEKIRFDYNSAARDCFLNAHEVFRAENDTNYEIRTLNQLGELFCHAAQSKQGDVVNCLYLARRYCELAERACDSNTPPELYNQTRDLLMQVNKLSSTLLQ